MVSQKYRWDFIGLSTDTKPTSETSDKVVNGSTYYCSDTSKLYVYCNGTWYERKPLGGGGGGGGTSDFNDLSNRPKYNGSDMTGSTNIPEVKTYTAGSNVAISDQNVISATDTTYSNFTGTDGTAAGVAGLVPAPATTDAGKFLKADGTWDTAGGGGGDTVYSSKTTSNSATGGAVYIGNLDANQGEQPDPTTTDNHFRYFWALPYDNNQIPQKSSINIFGQNDGGQSVSLGINAVTRLENQVSIGANTLNNYSATEGVAIGYNAQSQAASSVALGARATATRAGEVNVGNRSGEGFNNTEYRVIGGVHDGVNAHDAATVAQGNTLSTTAPTTSTVGVLGQLYTDTTNMHTYQCTSISGDTYTWTQRW